jgi:chromosome partitioning protein
MMNPVMLASEAVNYLEISLPGLHKQLKNKGLDYIKRQNKICFGHETAREIFNLKLKPTCWSWQNLKGGVGKTHLSFATAIRLSLYGVKVAVIDLDQQGNFTQACGVIAEDKPALIDVIHQRLNIVDCMVPVLPGIDILPSRIENAVLDNLFAINGLPVDKELKKRVDLLKKHYDIIFIDCPPSLGQSVTSASLSADRIIVPVDPERFSLSGLNITLSELNNNVAEKYDRELDIYIVLNKFDGRTGLSHTTLAALFNDEKYRNRLFKTFIRTSQELPNAVAKEKTIFDSLRSSTAKEDIDLLTREIIEFSLIKPECNSHLKDSKKEKIKEVMAE